MNKSNAAACCLQRRIAASWLFGVAALHAVFDLFTFAPFPLRSLSQLF